MRIVLPLSIKSIAILILQKAFSISLILFNLSLIVFDVFSTSPKHLSCLTVHLSTNEIALIKLLKDVLDWAMALLNVGPASSAEALLDHCPLNPLPLIHLKSDGSFRLVGRPPLQITISILVNIMKVSQMVDLLNKLLRNAQLANVIVLHISYFDLALDLSCVVLQSNQLSPQLINLVILGFSELNDCLSEVFRIFLIPGLSLSH